MKTLGQKMKEQLNIPTENHFKEVSEHQKQKVRDYLEDIRKPIEKRFSDIPKAGLYREMIKHKVKIRLEKKDEQLEMKPQTKFLIDICALYFSKDRRFLSCRNFSDPSLKKGLLIIGGCGIGKSLIVGSATSMIFDKNVFAQRTCDQVVNDFDTQGSNGLKRYKKQEWYFDDLGSENEGKFYSKREDVFTSLLINRYELFVREGCRTVITTNFTPEKIGKRYGARIESRLYEMFNIIVVKGDDLRKSKKRWKKKKS